MSLRLLLAGTLLALVGLPAGVASADEGDPPSGPEACVMEAVNQRRGEPDLEWSGSIQDELRTHASRMAERDELGHTAMSVRVAGLPDGWTGYGEASATSSLLDSDARGVEAWCQTVAELFWDSTAHRRVLQEDGYRFASVGAHWDGEKIWVVVGVFAHPSYRPAAVRWPGSYTEGLLGTWDGHFYDDDGSIFEADIDRMAAVGLTHGCNPPLGNRFCPEATVTRGEMAAFLARAFGWRSEDGDRFVDDDGSLFEGEIEALSARGVTQGCNPPDGDRFCPDRPVTRGEMATFLGRALGLEPSREERFVDTSRSVHFAYINAAAEAGITLGCDSHGTRYCPGAALSRAQMAAFLIRAGLAD